MEKSCFKLNHLGITRLPGYPNKVDPVWPFWAHIHLMSLSHSQFLRRLGRASVGHHGYQWGCKNRTISRGYVPENGVHFIMVPENGTWFLDGFHKCSYIT